MLEGGAAMSRPASKNHDGSNLDGMTMRGVTANKKALTTPTSELPAGRPAAILATN
jgi:hypothetical protein